MIACEVVVVLPSASMESGLDLVVIGGLVQCENLGVARTAAAVLDHRIDLGGRTGEHGFDRAISFVTHPSAQSQTPGCADGPATIPNTLNSTFDANMHGFSDFGHHLLPRTRDRGL